jgi:hypothetical protein
MAKETIGVTAETKKVCKKCGVAKEYEHFIPKWNSPHVYYDSCKTCIVHRKQYQNISRECKLCGVQFYTVRQYQRYCGDCGVSRAERITDDYVRQLLAGGSSVRGLKITAEMIEQKRMSIKIKRFINEQSRKTNTQGDNGRPNNGIS